MKKTTTQVLAAVSAATAPTAPQPQAVAAAGRKASKKTSDREKIRWRGGTNQQEAFCRHQMMADIYSLGHRTDWHFQLLSHDVDQDGVDITIIAESSMLPLQLKSRLWGSTTREWLVRRRVIFPENDGRLSRAILRWDGPATEGIGGALVVQEIVPTRKAPYFRLWYRIANLTLIHLRDPERASALVELARACPQHLEIRQRDLSPPVTIGECLWLCDLATRPDSDLLTDKESPYGYLTSETARPAQACKALRVFEKKAERRWRTWLKQNLATGAAFSASFADG